MKLIEYICSKIPPEEALAQLAEEAAELSHAALKLRRAMGGPNPTPVSEEDAWRQLREEVADVLLVLLLFDIRASDENLKRRMVDKMKRWVQRLRDKEKEEKV